MFASYSTTKRASPGVEPGTFRTQSEDNAIRPTAMSSPIYQFDFFSVPDIFANIGELVSKPASLLDRRSNQLRPEQ